MMFNSALSFSSRQYPHQRLAASIIDPHSAYEYRESEHLGVKVLRSEVVLDIKDFLFDTGM